MVRRGRKRQVRAKNILVLVIILGLLITSVAYFSGIRFSVLETASSVWQMAVELNGVQVDQDIYWSRNELPPEAIVHTWGTSTIEFNIDGLPGKRPAGLFSWEYYGQKPQLKIQLQDLVHVDAEGNKIPADQPSEPDQFSTDNGTLRIYYYDFSVAIMTEMQIDKETKVAEIDEVFAGVFIRVRLTKSIFKNPVQAWFAGAEILKADPKLTNGAKLSEINQYSDWVVTPHAIPQNTGGDLNAYKSNDNNTLVLLFLGCTLRAGLREYKQNWFDIMFTQSVYNVEVLYRVRLKIVTYTPPITDPEEKQEMNHTNELEGVPPAANPLGDLYNAFADLGAWANNFFNSPGGMTFMIAVIVVAVLFIVLRTGISFRRK